MYAMQYRVGFPTATDMQAIRDRVAATGGRMDGFPGLAFKAFLMREVAQGAARNEYAPFYVWDDIDGMRAFCWGTLGYSAIVRDFGRQPIQDWTGIALVRGPRDFAAARSLTMRSVALPDGIAPADSIPGSTDEFLAGADPDTVARVAAVDMATWHVILVELSTRAIGAAAADATEYEVLHVSTGRETARAD